MSHVHFGLFNPFSQDYQLILPAFCWRAEKLFPEKTMTTDCVCPADLSYRHSGFSPNVLVNCCPFFSPAQGVGAPVTRTFAEFGKYVSLPANCFHHQRPRFFSSIHPFLLLESPVVSRARKVGWIAKELGVGHGGRIASLGFNTYGWVPSSTPLLNFFSEAPFPFPTLLLTATTTWTCGLVCPTAVASCTP